MSDIAIIDGLFCTPVGEVDPVGCTDSDSEASAASSLSSASTISCNRRRLGGTGDSSFPSTEVALESFRWTDGFSRMASWNSGNSVESFLAG